MGMTLTEKIFKEHQIEFSGDILDVYPDQVLTHDATGTMAFLQLEAIGVKTLKPLTIIYVDHNTLQPDFRNRDDHAYLMGMAGKMGAYFSPAGNGICHQVHLEEFAVPGQIMMGSDSHTPTAGGAGQLAIGLGGLAVASVMAGAPLPLTKPQIVGIRLHGELTGWATAKDVILHLLQTQTVKGNVGKIFEFYGPGVGSLSVYERATICNMGAELGVTSSIFVSDQRTYEFLNRVGRADAWRELHPDPDARYDEIIDTDLGSLEPLIALPHSPDNVKKVSEVEGVPIGQVAIGSCTNSSFYDLASVATMLKGRQVARGVDLVISAGSRRTFRAITELGYLQYMIEAGARILEVACGPCNGVGQAPASNSNTLRTYNRNFKGRSGTMDANIFLSGLPTAVASAVRGVITHPRSLGQAVRITVPDSLPLSVKTIIPPEENHFEPVMGPNIQPVPLGRLPQDYQAIPVVLKVGDNISTDDILPGGVELLALRSNCPGMAPHVFSRIDAGFKDRIPSLPDAWVLLGGENLGQGSSREQAALVPMSIGLRVVIAKSYARIFHQNLINYGVVPLILNDPDQLEACFQGDEFEFSDFANQLKAGEIKAFNKTRRLEIPLATDLNSRELEVVLVGGLLRYLRERYGA